jgi:hypothetical protein
MDVTRTIRYEGSSKGALDLLRMLKDEGVHVELPPELLEPLLASTLAPRAEKRQEIAALRNENRQKREVRQHREQRELADRQIQERRELQERQAQEWHELEARQHREQHELTLRHAVELEVVDPYRPMLSTSVLLTDLNQVIVSLASSGSLIAITAAVKKFKDRNPRSKVKVEDTAQSRGDDSPQAPRPGSE